MGRQYEIRLAGEGGQGLILAGAILVEAAATYDGKNAAQTQSYGPEARGGFSGAEVVISDEEIDYPKVTEADALLAMSQEAFDRYWQNLKSGGILITDSLLVRHVPLANAYRLPITQIAERVTGRHVMATIVALGLLVGLTNVVSEISIESALLARAPQGTEELNLRALRAGLALARELKAQPAPAPAPTTTCQREV